MNRCPALSGSKWTFSLEHGGEVFLCLNSGEDLVTQPL